MFIKITRLSRELNEEASKRYEKFEDEVSMRFEKEPTDDEGRTKQWYEDLNLPVPQDLLNKSNNEDYIEFDLEKDYNIVKRSSLINYNHITDVDNTEDEESFLGSSVISLTDGSKVLAEETIEEIQKLVQTKNIIK